MNIPRIFLKRIFNFSTLVLVTLISISTAQAQYNGVDPTFNALPSKETAETLNANLTVQPDGKVIIFGNFFTVNGAIKPRIARLNADGTPDNSFNCDAACGFAINSVVVQPDGKILVAGGDSGNFGLARIVRLNSDGSLDNTFTSPFTNSGGAGVLAVQADGKIYVARTIAFQIIYTILSRLNPDGSIDNTFNPLYFDFSNSREYLNKLLILPDGKLLIAGKHSFGFVFRVNPDGTKDTQFESPLLAYSPPQASLSPNASDVVVQTDGKIVFTGGFNTANGITRNGFARLNTNGSIDTTFNPPISASSIELQPGGKLIAQSGSALRRLNDDGSIDNTFNQPASLEISRWAFDGAGNILFFGRLSGGQFFYGRLNAADGSLDSTFNATVGTGAPGKVFAVAVQPDNKVLIYGDFTRVGNQPRLNFARLNADGSLDATFDAGTGFNNLVETIVVQADGKILVGGSFTSYNGTERRSIARLNADGSLDTSFNPMLTFNSGITGAVAAIAVQPSDGKIYVGGNFASVNGQIRTGIARLNSDGSLDASFNPTFGVDKILSIFIQPTDGKIMVGGGFIGVNGFNRAHLARLNPDGTLDTAFNAGNISPIRQVERQADGKYVALSINPSRVIRLNNDGASDPSFQTQSYNETVNRFVLQPDGAVIVVGSFTTVNNTSRLRIARLKSDGTIDTTFFSNGSNDEIRTIVRQADGKVIIGGSFTTIAGITRFGIARLTANPFQPPTRFDFDGDGRADIAVFRPSSGFWYQLSSQNNAFSATRFGISSDQIAPADYDGDGRADIAVFRGTVPGAGNFAYFYILNSANNSFVPVQFGATGDVPVSGDWDADGRADLAVYRDGSLTGGQSYFYYRPSSQPGANFRTIAWGAAGDKPLVGDFDGDGRLDAAVFRPSTATWYVLQSSNGQVIQTTFGLSTDIPTPADYDGDGRANIAVFRPSSGTWFTSTNPANNYGAVQFGANGDLPVAADYDGDGKADVAVFRPSNGAWYLNRSTQGFTGVTFGSAEDKPIPNAYVR